MTDRISTKEGFVDHYIRLRPHKKSFLDAGAQGFLQKPFSIAEISEKLKEVLEST